MADRAKSISSVQLQLAANARPHDGCWHGEAPRWSLAPCLARCWTKNLIVTVRTNHQCQEYWLTSPLRLAVCAQRWNMWTAPRMMSLCFCNLLPNVFVCRPEYKESITSKYPPLLDSWSPNSADITGAFLDCSAAALSSTCRMPWPRLAPRGWASEAVTVNLI